jgi:folylpolyglutamate synthase/dihydropteroate synthase
MVTYQRVAEAIERMTGRPSKSLVLERTETLLTAFEILNAVAFEAFRLAGCDAVVAEVGLGGRWDSTNLYRPGTKVITGIDFDHTELLGPDLWSIPREKSGIVHHGDTVVVSVRVHHGTASGTRLQGQRFTARENQK